MTSSQELNNFRAFKKIEIPVIQRDYVLGRDDAKEVRERFLDDLFNSLENDSEFHLDFVYGSYSEDKAFIPIDGQQRLTTLFLLHLYFAKKENKDYKIDFKYRTRKSAEEFCEFLLDIERKDIDFSQDEISSQLKNHKRFIPFWELDPTVESMLTVLDEIHKRGKDKEYFNKLEKVTFSIFELEGFPTEQAEELYRKMNSRGKVLTELENFKAMYEQIAYKEGIENYKRIAEKFEKNWSEFFWRYKDNSSYLIDEPFMNFIRFITEMKSYENGKKYEEVDVNSFNYLREFYKNKDNFLFLELCLDDLKKIESIAKYVKEKLVFFEGDYGKKNLFEEIIKNYNGITITNKILAYLMIRGTLEITDIKEDSNREKILDLLRIARNDLHRQRTLKTGKIAYTLTIENKDIPQLIKSYIFLIIDIKDKNTYEILLETTKTLESKSLKHEKEKAELIVNYGVKKEIYRLEDFKYLKGDLRIFLSDKFRIENIKSEADKVKFLSDKFISLFSNPNDLICRALLAVDDYKIPIGTVCRGNKYFFGQEDYWEIFFTHKTRQVGTSEEFEERIKLYSNFFNKLRSKLLQNKPLKESLEEIINEKLRTYEDKNKDWIYYFLKYPVIFSYLKNLKNVFGWVKAWDENGHLNTGFIEKLEKETKITSYHINIFLLALLGELLGGSDKIQNLSDYIQKDENCLTYLVYRNKEIRITENNEITILVINESNPNKKLIPLYGKEDAIKKSKDLIAQLENYSNITN
ncbi:DUF262 domain-containing protein [Persephonella sp.]